MNRLSVFKLCACCLGVLLLYTPASVSENALNLPAQQQLTQADILHKLAQADVVYLGETHDNAKDHETQLEIIEKLYSFTKQNNKDPKSKIAIALEMFQRPYQSVINQYLAGEITAAQLVEQSEYQQRWGFPWEYYAPILEFAKKHQIPVIALNTPSEVTRKVSRQGLESLNQEDWKYIPPISEIRTDNQEYRQLFEKLTGGHHHNLSGNSQKLDNYFTAQVLWDETMADAIANFVKVNPNYQVIVLAGSGHIIYGYGIPSRVARRLQNGDTKQPQLIQRSLLLHPPEDDELEINQQQIADFIWK
ncbi:MAG: ChaN family lipoprotein [Crinalium sp.]